MHTGKAKKAGCSAEATVVSYFACVLAFIIYLFIWIVIFDRLFCGFFGGFFK